MSLTSAWDNSNGVENRELPDGTYTVKIISVTLGETKTTFKKMLVWKAEILSGPTKGLLFINRVLDEAHQFMIDRAKQDFLTLGFQPTAADLEVVMTKLPDRVIDVKLATNDKNIQNQSILGYAEGVTKAAEPVLDNLPFC